jgi:predicted regulator of Ras-like GTPase activity (Roadblock/LC7/MglB family)
MMKKDELNNILIKLQSSSNDFEASAVVSEDGLMIASLLPQGNDETQIAAMSAAIMTMGKKAAEELKRGNLQQIFVKGDDGYVVIMQAGPHAVILALAREDAKLGLIFLGLSRAAEETSKALESI